MSNVGLVFKSGMIYGNASLTPTCSKTYPTYGVPDNRRRYLNLPARLRDSRRAERVEPVPAYLVAARRDSPSRWDPDSRYPTDTGDLDLADDDKRRHRLVVRHVRCDTGDEADDGLDGQANRRREG